MAAERTVDANVAALPDGQRQIAEAVRRLVRSAAPEAREAFRWAQPVFESGGPFAYIRVSEDRRSQRRRWGAWAATIRRTT